MIRLGRGLSRIDFSLLMAGIDEAAIVAVTDSRGVITYVNRKFCEISKYADHELLGRTHRVISSGFHGPEFFREMWRTISGGQIWEGEIRNRAKDGTPYWVNTTIVPFLDGDGRPEKFVSVRYDITESKRTEERLKVYAKRLELSNTELQEFAAVAAHDLQEPLRKIRSFLDRAKVKSAGLLPVEAEENLERAANSARRMQILINDLLSYSRVTTEAHPFGEVDLNKTLAQVCADLEGLIERSGGRVIVGDLPTIDADKTQMRQLFMNLVANALKFRRAGIAPTVEVTGELRGDERCVIRVKDNGIGFDVKYLDRIFTIFQRLHGRHEFEGTGIGLAICRKIVDRHAGDISAVSAPGEGALFEVSLPLAHRRGA